MFMIPHSPGSLADILGLFKQNKVNLTWIESFPFRDAKAKGEYVFFVDFDGHQEDPKVKKTLQALEKHCDQLHILGSFPVSIPVE
jgi:chorismate mutase/prephenate dehydratase